MGFDDECDEERWWLMVNDDECVDDLWMRMIFVKMGSRGMRVFEMKRWNEVKKTKQNQNITWLLGLGFESSVNLWFESRVFYFDKKKDFDSIQVQCLTRVKLSNPKTH